MVNAQVLQGQWNQVRGQLKRKWGQLTDDDLRFANGNMDQLIGRIQHKTGEARETIEGFLAEMTSQGASAIPQAAEAAAQYARMASGGREGSVRPDDPAWNRYFVISEGHAQTRDIPHDRIRENLWPQDLAANTTRSPLTILKEQASLLGYQTRNIVTAGVSRYSVGMRVIAGGDDNTKMISRPDSSQFTYAFNIEAPALDNYTYRLFTTTYDVNLFPVRFTLDQDIASELGLSAGESLDAVNEEDFKQKLALILGSQKTRKVINAILSQSTDLTPSFAMRNG